MQSGGLTKLVEAIEACRLTSFYLQRCPAGMHAELRAALNSGERRNASASTVPIFFLSFFLFACVVRIDTAVSSSLFFYFLDLFRRDCCHQPYYLKIEVKAYHHHNHECWGEIRGSLSCHAAVI